MSAFPFLNYLAKNPRTAKIIMIPQRTSLDAGTPFNEGLMPERPPGRIMPDEEDVRPFASDAAPIRKPASRPNKWAVTLMFGCRKVMITPIIVMVRMICEFSLDKVLFGIR